jgi:hypothetical protein
MGIRCGAVDARSHFLGNPSFVVIIVARVDETFCIQQRKQYQS